MTNSAKHWPAPKSYSRKLPRGTSTGSFWKWRSDRHHCGVDLFAPAGSLVLAVEPGRVIRRGSFTSPAKNAYWNRTFFVLVQHDSGVAAKYAELGKVLVRTGQRVAAGQKIGIVGSVLNPKRVDKTAPLYIRQMVRKTRVSMLHFELYSAPAKEAKNYSGGNWFAEEKPARLLDPTAYLKSARARASRM